jgi:hypothetical protein
MQDFASNSGVTLEPTLVAWSLGRNPVGILAKPGAKARMAGEMVLNGVRLDILDLDSPGYHAQLLLRKADGLPVRITTKITDRAKKSLGSTSREFNYLSVGKKLSDRAFSLSSKA